MSGHVHEPARSAVKRDGAPATHEYSVCECGKLIAKLSPNGQWVESTNQRHPYRLEAAAADPRAKR